MNALPCRRHRFQRSFRVALRSGRTARWRAGHRAQGSRLYRPHVQRRLFASSTCVTPKNPKTVAFVAAPKNTRSHHLQISGDILLVVNGPNIWAMSQYASQVDYYAHSLADSVKTDQPFGAGIRVFDISKPGQSARDRVPRHRRAWRSPHLVDRRPLRLRIGAFRRLHRPHPGDPRRHRSGKA